MATIARRKTRTGRTFWQLSHGRGAKRVRFAAGRTKDEAEGVLAQFKAQLRQHQQAPTEVTIAGEIDAYREYLLVNRRPGTVSRYVRVLETFASCFMAKFHSDVERLRDIKPAHIEEFKRRRSSGEIVDEKSEHDIAQEQQLRQELAEDPTRATMKANAKFGWLGRHSVKAKVSTGTVNYEVRALVTFFRWAIRQNHLFSNPATNVEKFRIPKRSLPRFMTSEDLRKFFAACHEDERLLFSAILLTGMRKGEVEHLQWSDINFELGVIFIQAKPDVGWQPKTDERIIPISTALQQLLFEQFARRRSELWVFANRRGQQDTHILEKLKRVCQRAGIRPATVHALRHSFGAHLRMAGVSLADIADLMGHKDLATTQIYAKVQQEHLRSAVGKLTGLVPAIESSGATLKRDTRDTTDAKPSQKLLRESGLAERPLPFPREG